jgi:RHS repeat-associated protein
VQGLRTYQSSVSFSGANCCLNVCSCSELANHLGNVLEVVTDRKLPVELGSSGTVDFYTADVVSYSDYYPYGMLMPNRHESAGDYRYGFQGQEMDDEIKGEGNSINYTFRMHDPRVGRFFAVDPLAAKYPYYSPYAFSGNEVIQKVELEGLEPATPPVPDATATPGVNMEEESIEGAQLPLTPPNATNLYVFQYTGFGVNRNLSAYSIWQFNPITQVWSGLARFRYKTDQNGNEIPFGVMSPPDGCVQNGVFTGICSISVPRTAGTNHFEQDPVFPGCPSTLADLTQGEIDNLFVAIEQDARNSVTRTATQTTLSVNVTLNSQLYDNDDVTRMQDNLIRSGLFVGVNLNVSLTNVISGVDSDGSTTQEIGGNVQRTIQTTTILNDARK